MNRGAPAPAPPPRNGRFWNFSLAHLRESHQGFWFAVDFGMLLLLTINLSLILLDSLYRVGFVEAAIRNHIPTATGPLEALKNNFLAIDLFFVCIFLTEFCIRWFVSVRQRTYDRWFFYPFIHWYDLVGCIPLTGTRLLRFLRVFSILHRLHRYRIIDIRQAAAYRFFAFYYDVLLEELSDRVIIKVLSGIQDDLAHDHTLSERILDTLIRPRAERLRVALAAITSTIGEAMQRENDHPFAVHLRRSITQAMRNNPDLRRLESVPLVGDQIAGHLQQAVTTMLIETIANLIEEIPDLLHAGTLEAGLHTSDTNWEEFDEEIRKLVYDILEFIKLQVGRQGWKAKM